MLKELDLRDLRLEFDLKFKGIIQVGSFVSKEFSKLKELGVSDFIFVEANPNIISELKNNVDESCIIFNELITDVDNVEYDFYISNHLQSSSMLKFDKHAHYYPTMSDVVDTIKLKSITLDSLIKREGVDMKKFNTLMLDVQGAEFMVINGFLKNINFIDYIYTEINFDTMYDGCILEPQFTDYMQSIGFHLLKHFNTGNGWGDALYVRR
jgi:FkbM family methyltransferase